jgi:hypothetical protein
MDGSVKRALIALLVLATAAATAGVACTSSESNVPTVDTVKVKLDFGGGVSLNNVDYILKGPGSFQQVGTLPVGAADTVTTTFQSLPVGNYGIKVKGTASDDASRCEGEAMFQVAPSSMMMASVNIPLVCSGIAGFSATVSTCPVLDSIAAVPAEVFVGSSLNLLLAAHDSDGLPAPLTATWATSSGVLTNLSIEGATFTCTAPGTFTIQVRVSDGMSNNRCADTGAVTVTCTPVAP